MSDKSTATIHLGGRTFEAPKLPLGVSILVYPICQRLTNAGLADRLMGREELAVSVEEMGDLTELAFQLAHADDETLDTQAFLALPVTPAELFAAFFLARIQCGGWQSTARTEGQEERGEAEGADETPPTSTSTESSPSSSDTSTSPSSIG